MDELHEEQEVEKLCRKGITVSNLKSSCLGRADMGKYMYNCISLKICP